MRTVAVYQLSSGKAQIADVTFPETAAPDTSVTISYILKNVGDTRSKILGKMTDIDLNQVIDTVEFTLDPNELSQKRIVTFTMPNRDLNLKLEAGHIDVVPRAVFSQYMTDIYLGETVHFAGWFDDSVGHVLLNFAYIIYLNGVEIRRESSGADGWVEFDVKPTVAGDNKVTFNVAGEYHINVKEYVGEYSWAGFCYTIGSSTTLWPVGTLYDEAKALAALKKYGSLSSTTITIYDANKNYVTKQIGKSFDFKLKAGSYLTLFGWSPGFGLYAIKLPDPDSYRYWYAVYITTEQTVWILKEAR